MKVAFIVGRSFIAMFWGWVACNAATVLLAAAHQQFRIDRVFIVLSELLYWCMGTALVIFAAWLFFFLPADLLVKESSVLRTPKWAAATVGCQVFSRYFCLA